MKLQCQVEVMNRLLPALNMRSTNTRYLKSTLAIGKEVKHENEYFIIHFSSANKTGIKYKLNKNVKQVFVRCVNEGKATIRFEQPPHDLCIKCDQLQLKGFLKILKCCLTGDTKELRLQNLSNVSVTAKNNIPTKLIVKERSDFPQKGLPRTLESLHINGLKMSNFRREILLLHHLTVLDLSNNEVEKLPAEVGRMQALTELVLANNMLANGGLKDWKWMSGAQISKNLRLLDLSGNSLNGLPHFIWKLTGLVTLKLDNNKLCNLPASLGRIKTLRYLTVAINQLSSLPCSLMQCRLEFIDLSRNKFGERYDENKNETDSMWNMYVGNLVRLAGTAVLKQRLFYASNIIPHTLVEYLDDAGSCTCGNPSLDKNIYKCKKFSLKDFYQVVVFDTNRDSSVHFDCFFCSHKCYANLSR